MNVNEQPLLHMLVISTEQAGKKLAILKPTGETIDYAVSVDHGWGYFKVSPTKDDTWHLEIPMLKEKLVYILKAYTDRSELKPIPSHLIPPFKKYLIREQLLGYHLQRANQELVEAAKEVGLDPVIGLNTCFNAEGHLCWGAYTKWKFYVCYALATEALDLWTTRYWERGGSLLVNDPDVLEAINTRMNLVDMD